MCIYFYAFRPSCGHHQEITQLCDAAETRHQACGPNNMRRNWSADYIASSEDCAECAATRQRQPTTQPQAPEPHGERRQHPILRNTLPRPISHPWRTHVTPSRIVLNNQQNPIPTLTRRLDAARLTIPSGGVVDGLPTHLSAETMETINISTHRYITERRRALRAEREALIGTMESYDVDEAVQDREDFIGRWGRDDGGDRERERERLRTRDFERALFPGAEAFRQPELRPRTPTPTPTPTQTWNPHAGRERHRRRESTRDFEAELRAIERGLDAAIIHRPTRASTVMHTRPGPRTPPPADNHHNHDHTRTHDQGHDHTHRTRRHRHTYRRSLDLDPTSGPEDEDAPMDTHVSYGGREHVLPWSQGPPLSRLAQRDLESAMWRYTGMDD